ncbi:hypothetical protein [Bartonella sp. MM73XJBT.G]|uniref:hypothetical protein n=1 Tax=Bartonella sp. MM73XJBT.G TaxID=3019097 RepID=UPI0023608BDB|nr:hypothetical protein [Bartonella sp. MM73XJBT.G]
MVSHRNRLREAGLFTRDRCEVEFSSFEMRGGQVKMVERSFHKRKEGGLGFMLYRYWWREKLYGYLVVKAVVKGVRGVLRDVCDDHF